MRTSTARANGWICPKCKSPTAQDHEGRGYVRHLQDVRDTEGRRCDFEEGLRDDPVPRSGVAEHTISSRNNTQVRVAGMAPTLRQLGYRRGARVTVINLSDLQQAMWEFEVANNEDATITCNNPPPPAWVQPGVRVRIEVLPPATPSTPVAPPAKEPVSETPGSSEPEKAGIWKKVGAWIAHHVGQIIVGVAIALILAYFGIKK